jgi:hypothetical protein
LVGGSVAMRFELLPQPEKATVKIIRIKSAHHDELRAKNDNERIHNLRNLDRAAQFVDIGAASQGAA